MTQDEIIEMARQAKAIPMHKDFNQLALIGTENLEAFAKLVAEKEREACATMSDWILKEGGGTWGDAIRARGQA
jgi:hypothetical protein